jgi:four helix bundle protein
MDTSKLKDLKYRTYDFSIQLIKFIGTVEVKQFYYSMLDQVLRSGTSISANVIEGRSGSSLRDLINFYRIALKSSNETKYWLCLLRDGLELDKIEINQLLKEADEISRIIAKSIITMKNKRKEVKKGDS